MSNIALDRFLSTQGEVNSFEQRNPVFMRVLPRLVDLIDAISHRPLHTPDLEGKVLAGVALVTIRSFRDIVLIARQGIGLGSLQLLRGMFERTITLAHIHAHPETAKDLVDYGAIQYHKHAKLMRDKLGEEAVSDEKLAELLARRQEVEQRFKRPLCDRAGCKPRLHHSWTPITPYQMAEAAQLDHLLPSAYSQPTLETHATIASVLSTATDLPNGIGILMSGGQQFEADVAVNIAHQLVLRVLKSVIERFALTDLQQLLEGCFLDLESVGPVAVPPTAPPSSK